jgi:epoxyqueuosine reductase
VDLNNPVEPASSRPRPDPVKLAADIKAWGRELGFAQVAISAVDQADPEAVAAELHLLEWLASGFHGDMDYMARHGHKRSRPAELVPGTVRVISLRLDYLPDPAGFVARGWQQLAAVDRANVSRYAQGRDYHKVLRSRLQALVDRLSAVLGPFGHRVFTDSAPVMEVELARKSGLGWRGKHTLLLNREGGSMFFLGEIFVDFALPIDASQSDHCGSCRACIDVCPTRAIIGPYRLDARRCISYLTIEHQGSIAPDLRPLMGNRIYGCDDCQLVCPWNKFARRTPLADFDERGFDELHLVDVFLWDEREFLRRTEGSPIRRIGHIRWLRNIAVALGNALASTRLDKAQREAIRVALQQRLRLPSELVREHVQWALEQEP